METKSKEAGVERVSQRAHETIDRISEKGERLMEKGDEWMQMGEDWLGTAREYVRENPLQALGIAVAAGYLLSILMRRD